MKPVVEIGAEPAGGNRVLEVPVGGRDDPDIDPDGFIRTNPLDLAGLQHPKQLDLHVFGQLAHLVEEDRAAVRRARIGRRDGRLPR